MPCYHVAVYVYVLALPQCNFSLIPGAAIQKMRHTLRHPKHCYSDILVAVEGWNQYDEFIQGSAILYEDEMQLPSGTWVWTTKDFKTGIETNTYIGCNTLKGTPVLIRPCLSP